jgi:UDP-2,3-diacylglucosamine hydrolase
MDLDPLVPLDGGLDSMSRMRTVLLGDAHLTPAKPEVHRRVVRFLRHLEADRLFILGDLFDFLVGLADTPRGDNAEVLDALLSVARRGVRVTYLEGNHDFHLAPLLAPDVEIWPGPGDARLGPLEVHLAHGDEIQRRDLGYALLRPAIRTDLFAAAVKLVGPHVVHTLGRRTAQTSRDLRAGRSRDWRAEKLRYVKRQVSRGADLVVLGHSHQLFHEPVGEGWVAQVGRFDRRDQHVVIEGRRLQLREGDRVMAEGRV